MVSRSILLAFPGSCPGARRRETKDGLVEMFDSFVPISSFETDKCFFIEGLVSVDCLTSES